MTVRELLMSMSARELTEWKAFYRLEPWGDQRGDLRAGIIASTIANVNRGRGKRAFTAQDFMPFIDRKTRGATLSEQIKNAFQRYGNGHHRSR